MAAICKHLTLDDPSEEPSSMQSDIFSEIFSRHDFDQFLKSIENADLSSVSGENKKYLEFFKASINDLTKFQESLKEVDYDKLEEQ